MSDVTPEATQEIEALLADRQRLQEWLDRLDASGTNAPTGVRQRVRADYEGRLAEVVARLRGFSTAISASLESLRNQRSELESQRNEAEEIRAEAELRHAVGEYSDHDWQRMDHESRQKTGALSGEIDRLSAEIARLDDVLSQVMPPEPKRAPAPPPAPSRPVRAVRDEEHLEIQILEREELTLTPRGQVSEEDENVVLLQPDHMDDVEAIRPEPRQPPEAPRFTPRGGTESRPQARPSPQPPRTLRFPAPGAAAPESGPSVDEMTFLKSVTLDSPATRERAAAENRPSSAARARGASAGKTLKCADCGSMNKPTEWYCERCGAELAAL